MIQMPTTGRELAPGHLTSVRSAFLALARIQAGLPLARSRRLTPGPGQAPSTQSGSPRPDHGQARARQMPLPGLVSPGPGAAIRPTSTTSTPSQSSARLSPGPRLLAVHSGHKSLSSEWPLAEAG